MDNDVVATVLTGMGVLFGVWRMVGTAVDRVRRDMTEAVGGVRSEVNGLRGDLTAEIRSVNHRIDAVLLADRPARPIGTS